MKYYFYKRSHTPSAFRLEPSLDEVFAEPEKYRRYFKPVLAIDISKILPEESGIVYFLYSTCAIQESFTFRIVDGKYQLAKYNFNNEPTTIDLVEDIPSAMNLDDIPLEEDEFLGDIKMNTDPDNRRKGGYLELYEYETNLRIADGEWHDNFRKFVDQAEVDDYLDYDEGYLGGQPHWLQFFGGEGGEEEGFVGQINPYSWGPFHDIKIYMHIYEENGEKYIDLNYQMS